MPCDIDFGRIEKKNVKRTRWSLATPLKWADLIRKADINNPFKVINVQHPFTDYLTDDGTVVVRVKNC